MSLALLPQVLLRILVDPTYAAKGSSLTWIQLDTDLKIIADAIRELAAVGDTSGFTPYNNVTVYSNTLPDYVSYQSNVYEYINPVPQSGITPGTDPLTWQLASQGLFAHERNKDQFLDFGGANQVSAADIYNLLNAGPLATDWGDILGDINDQTDLITLLGDYLLLSGGTMSGDINMGANDITNVDKISNSTLDFIDIINGFIFDNTGTNAVIKALTQILTDDNGVDSHDWTNRLLSDQIGDPAIDYTTARELIGTWLFPSGSKLRMGTYGTISETMGGLAYITGNSILSDNSANNQLIKISADQAHFMRMLYSVGISFHTNVTGGIGTTVADSVNRAMLISIDGNVYIDNGLSVLGGDISMADDRYIYLRGSSSVDGSTRMRDDGTSFKIERRVSGTWSAIFEG